MAELVYARRSYYPVTFIARVINVVVGVVELFLATRIILELLGANAGAAFIAWIYATTGTMVAPFAGAFPVLSLGSGSVLDFSALLGMIIYAVLGWLLIRLVAFVFASLQDTPLP